jgi:Cys-rich peptide (TIGR04165 family)
MKSEDFGKKCPNCGSTDKSIARKKNEEDQEQHESDYARHVPSCSMGVIRCTQCGYIFEYCEDRELPVKIKKIGL